MERDDIDTCGMHVGQLPEKFRLTAAQRHAGLIVPDETADDPVEGARPIKRWKSGGSHDVTSCDYAATSAPTRVPQGAESECDESRREDKRRRPLRSPGGHKTGREHV